MRKDLTDITLVVDRSGSMEGIKADAEGGINSFIKKQAKLPGEALLTLVQFDGEYEFIHNGVNIKEVPTYTLTPRGSTALLDAVGRAVNETGERLRKLPEEQRPGLVICVIVTDGGENASREFTRERVRQMIEEQQGKYNWQFTFLAANQDAFAAGASIGVNQVGSAGYNPNKMVTAYSNTSNKVSRMRGQSLRGEAVDNDYTEEERIVMN